MNIQKLLGAALFCLFFSLGGSGTSREGREVSEGVVRNPLKN